LDKDKKNTFFKNIRDLKLGIIKVYKTPSLPSHVLNFNHNIFVRIFRVIGGICLLLTLSKKVFEFNEYIIYLVIFINTLFLIYQFVLLIYRIINIYRILKSDQLDIRNSPLNNFATIFTKGLLCFKGICEGGIFTGTILGTGIAYDWALESANKEKVFAPLVGSFLEKLSGANSLTGEQKQQLDELDFIKRATQEKLESLRKLNSIVESNKEIESLIQNIECQDGIFSPEDKNSLLKAFKEEKASLLNKSNEVKKTLNMDELLKTFNKGKK
jgi:hypothetical protein